MSIPTIHTILDFLEAIGITVIKRPVSRDCFLPGLQLENGRLIIDMEKLLYAGDILHEAGHLATMPPEIRCTMADNLEDNDLNQGGEMMALAWSYAACIHLGIDPHIVFHPHGYKGGGAALINNFSKGNYVGVSTLQWAGMTYDDKKAREFNVAPYPHMLRWLREA